MLEHQINRWMRYAISLAVKGQGYVSPNPMVGAVLLASDGTFISAGYHHRFGGDHAEVETLKSAHRAGKDPRGGTLIVTLEPCCIHGKTPPCVEAIISAGIKKVYCGVLDPNPAVNGKGVEILRNAGVEVVSNVLARETAYVNRGFISWYKQNRAYCHIKVAVSLDGKMANPSGKSQWITGEEARRYTHLLRSRYDAIMVGGGTVATDDPELTVRLVRGVNPVRIIVSTKRGIPIESRIAQSAKEVRTILITGSQDPVPEERINGLEIVRVMVDKNGRMDPVELLQRLPGLGILSVLVEGGGNLLSSFMHAGVIDEITVATAPSVIGQGLSPFEGFVPTQWEQKPRYNLQSAKRYGTDLIINYRKEDSIFLPD